MKFILITACFACSLFASEQPIRNYNIATDKNAVANLFLEKDILTSAQSIETILQSSCLDITCDDSVIKRVAIVDHKVVGFILISRGQKIHPLIAPTQPIARVDFFAVINDYTDIGKTLLNQAIKDAISSWDASEVSIDVKKDSDLSTLIQDIANQNNGTGLLKSLINSITGSGSSDKLLLSTQQPGIHSLLGLVEYTLTKK